MSRTLNAGEARFLFEIAGTALQVVEFSAREEISRLFQVELTLAREEYVDFDDAIGKEALLTILSQEIDRYFHGIISQFSEIGSSGKFILYQATVVPYVWLLSLEQDCRIFQNLKVEEIVKTILADAKISADQFDFRLQNKYPEKEYCVQYRETNFDFISRLLEQEGIFYFFEHKKDGHCIVFGDSTVNYTRIKGESNVAFHRQDSLVPDQEVIYKIVVSRRIQSGKVSLRDFNFEKPSLDLTVADKAEKPHNIEQFLEIYDYPGEYMDQERGKDLAKIRLQEAVMFRDRMKGQGNCVRFIPGFTFNLTEHDREGFNKEYLLVRVRHCGSQPATLEALGGGDKDGFSYSNQFAGIPSSVTLKSEQRTTKPVVEGVQTAIVVGPSSEEIYTDKHGRVKVQFHWDRQGKKDEKSSCWIRVSQAWAGDGWGAMHIPRIGQEVIVDFLEGDPDRPIITGRVYHATNTPPYPLPEDKTISTLMSRTTPNGKTHNELFMEDRDGKTRVVLSNAYGHKITEDEQTQSLTVETRDQHKMVLDDKNKSITLQTTNAHTITLSDTETQGQGTLTIQTTNGNKIELDDKNKTIVARTTDGHTLLFDDQNKKIELVTTDGHSAVLSDDQQKISITSSKGHFMAIDDSGDSITLEDSSGQHRFRVDIGGSKLIIATDSGSIDLEAQSGTISIKGLDVNIEASNELNMKGAMNVTSEAGVQHNTKAAMVTTESSGPNTIKGMPVQIN